MNVAVITGAASGIGLALTKACLTNKMQVVMADHNESLLLRSSKELQQQYNTDVMIFKCDVTNEQEVQVLADKVYDKYEEIGLLINNAGIIGAIKPSWEITQDEINQVFNVNIHGLYNSVRAFIPKMQLSHKKSHIINISSIFGLISNSLISAYTASKHAVIAVSESLYYELQNFPNIKVSVACPAFVNTNLVNPNNKLTEQLKRFMQMAPSPDDIATKILIEAQQGNFYLLLDEENLKFIKDYTFNLNIKRAPSIHAYEKLITAISKKSNRDKAKSSETI